MRWYWGTLLALALIVAVPLGGLWLWGSPRDHVMMPTATTSPADVVRTYARAMNDRDFEACKRMGLGEAGDIGASWTTLQGPQMYDVKIHGVSHLALRGWQQAVTVDTSETTKSLDGTPDPEAHIFSFELVRHDSSQPWRIIDFGEG